jgi:uncharacterized membrane protein
MPDHNINIPLLLKLAFRLFKEYASFVIGVGATYFVLGFVPNFYLAVNLPAEPSTESQILSMIFLLIRLYLALGVTKIMLFLADERPVEVKDLVNNGRIFLSYATGYFIYIIAVAIGLFLLIIPGIYLAIRLQLFPYYTIQDGDTSFVALQKSWDATKEWGIELFLFGLCMIVLNLLGIFFFGVGLIFTYPLTLLATAIVFLGLEEDAEKIPAGKFDLTGD